MTRKNGETTGRDASGRFAEGNPGRPRGARHKATQAVLALLGGEARLFPAMLFFILRLYRRWAILNHV